MRTAIFVDGANLAGTSRALGYFVDFKKVLDWVDAEHELVRACYYTAVLEDEDGQEMLRGLRDWLDYNGWQVVKKPAKQFQQPDGKIKLKGNLDVELVVDMLRLAPRVEQIILFSGDGDFRYAVQAIQELGCRVIVVSSIRTPQSMIADELRRQADRFLDLADMAHILRRD